MTCGTLADLVESRFDTSITRHSFSSRTERELICDINSGPFTKGEAFYRKTESGIEFGIR